jgi:hypothetical protein
MRATFWYTGTMIIKLKKRPKCQVPGCDKNAQLITSIKKWKFRKTSWVAEKYDCEGYTCMKHHSIHYGIGGWDYKIHRKDYCENIDGRLGYKCTTTIVDPEWQLDGDHIDGNPTHNDAKNIQTLCKCCHAIKTRNEKDYLTDGRKTLKVA